jgi:glycine/D-amino acid oxidase-like deaminating enzyme
LIGLVPGFERLVVAAGNGAWGVSTGPATARLAADTVLSGSGAGVPAALIARRYEAPKPA